VHVDGGFASTRTARDGDRVYMRTATPILVNGQFVVPVESYAEGTVSRAAQHVRTRRDFRGRSQPSVRCPRNRRNSNAARPGWSNPPQTTGQTAATATSTLTTFAIDFNYRPNALATKPAGPSLVGGSPPYATPLYAGATPGFAGLYQINFRVPPSPAGLQPCAALGSATPYSNVVQSNLTVSAGSVFSFDGAGICVQPEN
jgi:hypothetical protein